MRFCLAPVRTFLVLVTITLFVAATPIVTESTTFNPSTSLYTYQYAVDYSGLTINEFLVYAHGGFPDSMFEPVDHTEPPNWVFSSRIGSALSIFGGPPGAPITLWGWNIFPDSTLGTAAFTFTTSFAPTSRNYFIFDTRGAGTAFTGAVIGPAVPDTAGAIPEPATIWMLVAAMLTSVVRPTKSGSVPERKRIE